MALLNTVAVDCKRYDHVFSRQDQAYERLEEIKARLSEIEARLRELDVVSVDTWLRQPLLQVEYNRLVSEQTDLYAEVNEIEMGTWNGGNKLH